VGTGPPVVLPHGCPFSSFVWRNILPALAAAGHLCLAPDLLGVGDTETSRVADWSLPPQADMVVGSLDVLGLEQLATDIPGVERVEVLADAGHLVMEDQPRQVAELLIELLATPTGTPQPLRSGSAQP
jgi:pimeloyl-ACP methyl ester carboxylesterase